MPCHCCSPQCSSHQWVHRASRQEIKWKVCKSVKWGVFFVQKWKMEVFFCRKKWTFTFPQRRVHYVQYQYFYFTFYLFGGVYAPNAPPLPTGLFIMMSYHCCSPQRSSHQWVHHDAMSLLQPTAFISSVSSSWCHITAAAHSVHLISECIQHIQQQLLTQWPHLRQLHHLRTHTSNAETTVQVRQTKTGNFPTIILLHLRNGARYKYSEQTEWSAFVASTSLFYLIISITFPRSLPIRIPPIHLQFHDFTQFST